MASARPWNSLATVTARFEDGELVTVSAEVCADSHRKNRLPPTIAVAAALDTIEARREDTYEVLSVSTPTSILTDLTATMQNGASRIGRERGMLAKLRRPRLRIPPPMDPLRHGRWTDQ